jgi:hypothetical protein
MTASPSVHMAETAIVHGESASSGRFSCGTPVAAVSTMLRLNRAQRAILAEKVPDIANIGAGALVFGQTLDGGQFSGSLALVGFVVWVLLFGFAMMFAGGAQE